MPSASQKYENTRIFVTKNRNVLENASIPETKPFPRAVKRADANIFVPMNKKESEKITKPDLAILYTSEPSLKNIPTM